MESNKIPITVAEGDGIGPEIMQATLSILESAGAPLEYHPVEIGEKVYLRGQKAGIDPKTWDTIRNTKAFLKAPITTPQGGGYKSLNVTVRTTLGLYANIRPCVSYYPFVETKHPKMDVTIIRENEEDLYVGIEYRQTQETYQALKIISQSGSERIIRYAFEYAKAHQRKKVTCFTKDNILKISDGQFHKVFDDIAKEYPQIENEHWIVDIGMAKVAASPEEFDVIVLPNLYGDILSDITAQITGSVGLAGSANIGKQGAMFEAIHGSAPRRAGKNVANPSGLLLASIMMLVHLDQPEIAENVHNAWLTTIEEGIHTYDIFKEGVSKEKVGTQEFAKAVIERIGKKPQKLKTISYTSQKQVQIYSSSSIGNDHKVLVGADIFIDWKKGTDELAKLLLKIQNDKLSLTLIANRGVKVWPEGAPETFVTDNWRCRFTQNNQDEPLKHSDIIEIYHKLAEQDIDFIKSEHLYLFNDKPGYSLSQEEQ